MFNKIILTTSMIILGLLFQNSALSAPALIECQPTEVGEQVLCTDGRIQKVFNREEECAIYYGFSANSTLSANSQRAFFCVFGSGDSPACEPDWLKKCPVPQN